MRADFELFPTHADRIFDSVFEIEGEAFWYDLEYRTVHEIDPILTHIECSIDIFFSDIESCYGYNTRFACDIDMNP